MKEKIDLLDRQEFVDRMFNVTELLAKRKQNVCYAVNGGWGVGKSFVLDMFEEQIRNVKADDECDDSDSEEESGNLKEKVAIKEKYMVFRYNCWKYDYYDEPLIAIVSSLLDSIDEEVYWISDEDRGKVKGVLKAVGAGLLENVYQRFKDKTGIDAKKLAEILENGIKNSEEKWAEKNEYDSYFTFKTTLENLRKTIEELAVEQTLIFIVDELDRCIPEYTIQVLERLHHVFDDVENVQVVLAIDKEQLNHTVRNIYGEGVDVERYFEKFIDFELNLDAGSVNAQFNEIFKEYTELFNEPLKPIELAELDEFKTLIFEGMDTRGRIAVVNKCLLLHSLLCKEKEKFSHLYMCAEILLVMADQLNIDLRNEPLDKRRTDAQTNRNNKYVEDGLALLNDNFYTERGNSKYVYTEGSMSIIQLSDLWSHILVICRYLKKKNDHWRNVGYAGCDLVDLNRYCDDFLNLLKSIN